MPADSAWKQARGRRRGNSSGRSGSESVGGEVRKAKDPKQTLAQWCDANRIHKKVAGLVAKGEAAPRVVAILKGYQARGEILSGSQSTGLKGELSGAGDWSSAADKREAPKQASPPSRRAAFSDVTKRPRS